MVIKKFIENDNISYTTAEWALPPFVTDVSIIEILRAPKPFFLERIHPSLGFGVLYGQMIGVVDLRKINSNWSSTNKERFRNIINKNKGVETEFVIKKGYEVTLDYLRNNIKWYLDKFYEVNDEELNAFIKYVQEKEVLFLNLYYKGELFSVDVSVIEDRLYGILTSWNINYKRFSPGYYSVLQCFEFMKKYGIDLYDFGPVDEEWAYKNRFVTDLYNECKGIAIFNSGDERIIGSSKVNQIYEETI